MWESGMEAGGASDEKDVGVFRSLIRMRRCHKDALRVRRSIPCLPCSHKGWSFGFNLKAQSQFLRKSREEIC